MKNLFLICFCLIYSIYSFSQISVTKTPGTSVITKLGMGISVNKGSTLMREKYTLNDANCFIQLNDVGIETIYENKYAFIETGSFTAKEPIVAYEIHHILYNVFGEHMKTLSSTELVDVEGSYNFPKTGSWYASENNVSDYYICVSYVANVRTKNGQLWHYDFKAIKEQLSKLKIAFEEGYLPKKDTEK